MTFNHSSLWRTGSSLLALHIVLLTLMPSDTMAMNMKKVYMDSGMTKEQAEAAVSSGQSRSAQETLKYAKEVGAVKKIGGGAAMSQGAAQNVTTALQKGGVKITDSMPKEDIDAAAALVTAGMGAVTQAAINKLKAKGVTTENAKIIASVMGNPKLLAAYDAIATAGWTDVTIDIIKAYLTLTTAPAEDWIATKGKPTQEECKVYATATNKKIKLTKELFPVLVIYAAANGDKIPEGEELKWLVNLIPNLTKWTGGPITEDNLKDAATIEDAIEEGGKHAKLDETTWKVMQKIRTLAKGDPTLDELNAALVVINLAKKATGGAIDATNITLGIIDAVRTLEAGKLSFATQDQVEMYAAAKPGELRPADKGGFKGADPTQEDVATALDMFNENGIPEASGHQLMLWIDPQDVGGIAAYNAATKGPNAFVAVQKTYADEVGKNLATQDQLDACRDALIEDVVGGREF